MDVIRALLCGVDSRASSFWKLRVREAEVVGASDLSDCTAKQDMIPSRRTLP